jgi:hypothetical protein
MIGVLQDILCAILGLGAWFQFALLSAVNWLIAGVGAFAALLVALLPDMPDQPASLDGTVIGYLNYFFPVAGLVVLLATFVTIWAAFLLIRIPLKWAKVL